MRARSILCLLFFAFIGTLQAMQAQEMTGDPTDAKRRARTPTGDVLSTQDHYLISAKAGRVNAVFGLVDYQRDGKWQQLPARFALDSGDVVRTRANGRVEMLLNPGSYLRMAENSELELSNASLDDLRIKVQRGSVIIEITGASGARLRLHATTPQSEIVIDRNGLYRINVAADGQAEVAVYKGKVRVNGVEVKDGRRLASGMTEPVKFDKKQRDPFDQWSRERAELLAQANRRLSERTINMAFWSFRGSGAWGYGRAPYFGLWIYDRGLDCYTFLPFYSSWSSPYGIGYRNGFGIPWYYARPELPRADSLPTAQPTPGLTSTSPSGGMPHKLPAEVLEARPLPAEQLERQMQSIERFDRDLQMRTLDRGIETGGGVGGRPVDVPARTRAIEAAPAAVPSVPAASPAPSVPNDVPRPSHKVGREMDVP